jgi:hypothetical protein
METKQQLIINIKEWIKINSDINTLKAKIKVKNEEKKLVSAKLLSTMKENEIDCFEITGGSLVYKKNVVKKPISGKTLLSVLKQYYPEENHSLAEEMAKYILDNREVSIKEIIKHKVDKN